MFWGTSQRVNPVCPYYVEDVCVTHHPTVENTLLHQLTGWNNRHDVGYDPNVLRAVFCTTLSQTRKVFANSVSFKISADFIYHPVQYTQPSYYQEEEEEEEEKIDEVSRELSCDDIRKLFPLCWGWVLRVSLSLCIRNALQNQLTRGKSVSNDNIVNQVEASQKISAERTTTDNNGNFQKKRVLKVNTPSISVDISSYQVIAYKLMLAKLDSFILSHKWLNGESKNGKRAVYARLGKTQYAYDWKYLTYKEYKKKFHPLPQICGYMSPEVFAEKEVKCNPRFYFDWMHSNQNRVYNPLLFCIMSENDVASRYSLYTACVWLMNKLMINSRDDDFDVYLGFVDLFYNCLGMHDGTRKCAVFTDYWLLNTPLKGNQHLTAWVMWKPTPLRALRAGQLPDYSTLIDGVFYWGVQPTQVFCEDGTSSQCSQLAVDLQRVFDKSNIYSGKRRGLFNTIKKLSKKNDAFYKLFKGVFWCMMVGAYPGNMERPRMRGLLRAYEICWKGGDGNLLLTELSKHKNKSSMVIFTAFRLYIQYCMKNNASFCNTVRECIDWDKYVYFTNQGALYMRKDGNFFKENVFENSIGYLDSMDNGNMGMKKFKNKYRQKKTLCSAFILQHVLGWFRKNSVDVANLFDQWSKELRLIALGEGEEEEDDVGNNNSNQTIPGYIKDAYGSKNNEQLIKDLERERQLIVSSLPRLVKNNIVNLVVRLQPHERKQQKVIEILQLESYGGLSKEAVVSVMRMIDNYFKVKEMPKSFKRILLDIKLKEAKVVAWYFYCVSVFESIYLTPIPLNMIGDQIEVVRNGIRWVINEEDLFRSHFDVNVSICCQKMYHVTLKRLQKKPNNNMCYDSSRFEIVCNKKRKKDNLQSTLTNNLMGGEENDPQLEELLLLGNAKESRKRKRNTEKNSSSLEEGDEEEEDDDDENDNIFSRSFGQSGSSVVHSFTTYDTKKRFAKLPCKRQPILKFNILGRMLNVVKPGKKLESRLLCPKCGLIHIYNPKNWVGENYMCSHCIVDENLHSVWFPECAYCKRETNIVRSNLDSKKHASYKKPVLVSVSHGDPQNNHIEDDDGGESMDCVIERLNTMEYTFLCPAHRHVIHNKNWFVKTHIWQKIKNSR